MEKRSQPWFHLSRRCGSYLQRYSDYNTRKKAGLDVEHAGDVYSLACSQNQTAIDIMEDAKEYLANTIAIIYAFVDPEIVILGGSVAIKIPGFVEDVEQRVKTKVYPNIQPLVKVVKTNLSEDSGLLGAACLAFLQV